MARYQRPKRSFHTPLNAFSVRLLLRGADGKLLTISHYPNGSDRSDQWKRTRPMVSGCERLSSSSSFITPTRQHKII